jgi:hypothetical protein
MTSDLKATDPTMDLGARVLRMLADGYDGEQIAGALYTTAEEAKRALVAYTTRILDGTAPKAMPSAECGLPNAYDGFCHRHGVFHVDGAA